jgi:hypothetical protein
MDRTTQIFRRQQGLITAEQAREAGLTYRQIAHRVTTGAWIRNRNGVYTLATTALDWETRLRRAVLGRRSVVSHRSASVLWGLGVFAEPKPEITVPSGAHKGTDALMHKTTQWDLRDEITRRGMPCTGIERTIVDCAIGCDLDTIERLAESAIRQELTTWHQLEATAQAHAGRGRTGPANFVRLIERRKQVLEVARSDFGLRVRQVLVAAGVSEPVLEHQVVSPQGKHLLYLDAAWPEHMKAWELDSREWHSGIDRFETDRRKRNAVKAQGWTIQEITWKMFEQPTTLAAMARDFLQA